MSMHDEKYASLVGSNSALGAGDEQEDLQELSMLRSPAGMGHMASLWLLKALLERCNQQHVAQWDGIFSAGCGSEGNHKRG